MPNHKFKCGDLLKMRTFNEKVPGAYPAKFLVIGQAKLGDDATDNEWANYYLTHSSNDIGTATTWLPEGLLQKWEED